MTKDEFVIKICPSQPLELLIDYEYIINKLKNKLGDKLSNEVIAALQEMDKEQYK